MATSKTPTADDIYERSKDDKNNIVGSEIRDACREYNSLIAELRVELAESTRKCKQLCMVYGAALFAQRDSKDWRDVETLATDDFILFVAKTNTGIVRLCHWSPLHNHFMDDRGNPMLGIVKWHPIPPENGVQDAY